MRHAWTVAWLGGAALLLLAGSAAAQDPEGQPPNEGTTTAPPPTADEQPVQPTATTTAPFGTAALVPQPQPPTQIPGQPPEQQAEQPPPTTPLPIGTADPNLPARVPATSVAPVTVPQPALVLSVDRRQAAPAQPFTFTVSSTDPNELARNRIQVSITRGGRVFRTLRAGRDGRYRTALPIGSYEARAIANINSTAALTARLLPRISNQLSVRVIDPRVDTPVPEPAAQPEPQKPAVVEATPEPQPAPVVVRSVAPAPWPWLQIAAAAVSLIALGGAVQWLRTRPSGNREPPPVTPKLTAKTAVTHDVTFLSPPRLRFRISARAIPDKGQQRIVPPSTPAPKLEDHHDRRADRP